MKANIYKSARDISGMSQERAAELLHIHVNTLSGWENGRGEPDKKMIGEMILIYNTPHLAQQYVFDSPLQQYVPNFEVKDLPIAVLSFLNNLAKIEKKRDKILEIASDGIIDTHEEEFWEEIADDSKKLADSAYEMIYSNK